MECPDYKTTKKHVTLSFVNIAFKKALHKEHIKESKKNPFPTFPVRFYIPIIISNLNSNCSNLLDLVKKAFCFKNCTDLSL